MNSFHALLFAQATDELKAIGKISKSEDAAIKLGITVDQYKNFRSERTAIDPANWRNFLNKVKELDPKYTYQRLVDQLLP